MAPIDQTRITDAGVYGRVESKPDAIPNHRCHPFANVKITENVIEFETHDKNGTFYWSLTVRTNRNRGLLHGSCREMLIDEPVLKQH